MDSSKQLLKNVFFVLCSPVRETDGTTTVDLPALWKAKTAKCRNLFPFNLGIHDEFLRDGGVAQWNPRTNRSSDVTIDSPPTAVRLYFDLNFLCCEAPNGKYLVDGVV